MRLRSRLLKFFTYRPSIISFGSKAKAQLAKVAIVLSVNLKSNKGIESTNASCFKYDG